MIFWEDINCPLKLWWWTFCIDLATFCRVYLRLVINSGLRSTEGSNQSGSNGMSTINSTSIQSYLHVLLHNKSYYLVKRIMEMGFCKWAKWKVNCSVLQPAIARWRRRRRRLPRRLCQFLQWNFHILFQLHCIKSFMHLSFSLYLALRAACWLLPFANV